MPERKCIFDPEKSDCFWNKNGSCILVKVSKSMVRRIESLNEEAKFDRILCPLSEE